MTEKQMDQTTIPILTSLLDMIAYDSHPLKMQSKQAIHNLHIHTCSRQTETSNKIIRTLYKYKQIKPIFNMNLT
jgi:hypothetical protein